MRGFWLFTCTIGLEVLMALAPTVAAAADTSTDWDTTRPRGKTRHIAFTVTEGTGMSVDISPDGRWLVFDLLSHVYRLPVTGGRAQSLTQGSGIALNYHPRISPDGRQIAFVSDRGGQNNLWIMQADGSQARQVFANLDTQVAEPAWTPDGKALIAVRYYPHSQGPWTRTNRLWLFPLDGSAPRELSTSSATLVYSPSVSSDGRYVYYHSSSMPVIAEGYYKIGTSHELRRVELTTGRDELVIHAAGRRYYHREPFYAFAPSVSPDGQWLAFARRVPGGVTVHAGVTYAQRTGLWVRNLHSGEERLVVDQLTPDQLETHTMYQIRLLPGYAWARDSASIVYAEGGKLRRSHLADKRVDTIAFEAPVEREISEAVRPSRSIQDDAFDVKFARWPTISPDGRTLAFEAAGSIWLQSSDGGAPRRLTTRHDDPGELTVELSPAWSPDGKSLAYATWSDESGGHVWSAAVAGGRPRRLTEGASEYLNPAWSADGRRIVVARGSGAGLRGEGTGNHPWFDVLSLSSRGGDLKVVARVKPPGEDFFVRPGYLADGRIFFLGGAAVRETQANSKVTTVLRSVRPDGTDERAHAAFSHVSDAQLSPDGRTLAFVDFENVYLARLDTSAESSAPFINRVAHPTSVRELSPAGGFYPRWHRDGKLVHASGMRAYQFNGTGDLEREWQLSVRLPVPRPQGAIAFTNARIITMDQRRVIERGNILVRGNRIVALGDVDVRGADHVIDMMGKTVMPGLIDVHAHHHSGAPDGEIVPPRRAESANYLAYGVTTTFDPAAPSHMVFPAADLTAAGKLIGPRLYSTGQVIIGAPGTAALDSLVHTRRVVDRLETWGAIGLKQYYQPRRTQRQWVSEVARERGDVFVTGEGMDFAYDLSMVMDGQTAWEHPILDIPLYDDVIQFLTRSGVTYNPELITPGQGLYALEYFMSRTDLTKDPKQQRWVRWDQLMRKKNHTQRPWAEYPAAFSVQAVKDLVRSGARVGVGGHGQEQGLGTHWEIWTFGFGLDPLEALEAATIRNAEYLGLDRDLGSVSVGKLADLVVLEADPLADLHNSVRISHVMLAGRLFAAATLDEIWPRNRAYGPRRWTVQEAAGGRVSSAP